MICVVIGGGAAGVFAAIAAGRASPSARVILLERSGQWLSKVKISGGGRCNVTHAEFEPRALIKNYPRGATELLSTFARFQPQDTIDWFKAEGVLLKREADGRMFPITDSSETIRQALLNAADKAGVDRRLHQRIAHLSRNDSTFCVQIETEEIIHADRLLIATGSAPQGHLWAQSFGHTVIPPVPSLFTFNVPTSPFLDLAGIAVQDVVVSLPQYRLTQRGPLLITHWGFSGPAILKLSAWAARHLAQDAYSTPILINWVPDLSIKEVEEALIDYKNAYPQRYIDQAPLFSLPHNLWRRLVELANLPVDQGVARIPHAQLHKLARLCHASPLHMEGKTTYKQEFVTCGGISLKEIAIPRMESRLIPHLHFAGEILDVDGVTGGFNFQHAWTSGWIAGTSMTNTLS